MRKEALWLALLFLTILGAMALTPMLEQPPALRTTNAPGQFNAVRAKARLAFIFGDQRPHPADTAADDAVRERLITALQQMGIQPVVREQFACNNLFKQGGVSCARVRNVIAVLGPTTGKGLLLNAHYDSVPVGPGASDDGIGVASLLEIASILKNCAATPTPSPLGSSEVETRPSTTLRTNGCFLRRPVILLFDEGEELGLAGARAFLADPLSRKVDSLINLEARGVRGPVNMFETSRPNAAPVGIFTAAVKNPVANSLATDVYRLLPNYTDVNSFAERGWLTLNLAPIGNETRYHSAGDDLAALDPATLQHMGDQTLALAEKLADGTPRIPQSNRIFMDLGGRALIGLPLVIGTILLVALLLAFLALSIVRAAMWRGLAVSAGSFVGSGAVAGVLVTLVGAFRGGEFWRAEPVWTHLASYASTILVGAALLCAVGRTATLSQLRSAFWLFLLITGGLIGLIAPGGIIFFIFPPLLALIGIIAARWWRPAELVGSVTAILFLYLTWGGTLGLLEELLDNGPMWLFAPLGSLIILPVLIEAKPLIARTGLRAVSLVGGVLALAGYTIVAAAPAYFADRQQRFTIEHITDASTQRSWWSVLNDGAALPNGFPGHWSRGELPFSDRQRWLTSAPVDPTAMPPAVQLLSTTAAGQERTITLRLILNGNNNVVLVAPPDARIRSAGTAGFIRPIDQSASGRYTIACSGRSCDGAVLQLTIGQRKPVPFIALGSKWALPPSAAPLLAARPRYARPQYTPDESIAFTRINL